MSNHFFNHRIAYMILLGNFYKQMPKGNEIISLKNKTSNVLRLVVQF